MGEEKYQFFIKKIILRSQYVAYLITAGCYRVIEVRTTAHSARTFQVGVTQVSVRQAKKNLIKKPPFLSLGLSQNINLYEVNVYCFTMEVPCHTTSDS